MWFWKTAWQLTCVAQPNGLRLSCGALRKIHSLIYARRQLQALVRQQLTTLSAGV